MYGNFRNAFHQVGQSATYVEALNTARAAAVQIYKVESKSIWYKKSFVRIDNRNLTRFALGRHIVPPPRF